jgi:hypothetical protein
LLHLVHNPEADVQRSDFDAPRQSRFLINASDRTMTDLQRTHLTRADLDRSAG